MGLLAVFKEKVMRDYDRKYHFADEL